MCIRLDFKHVHNPAAAAAAPDFFVAAAGESHGRESGPVRVGPRPSPSELRRRQAKRIRRAAPSPEATSGTRQSC